MTDDFIGKSFILSALCNLMKKDARVDTEHPLLQILLLPKHRLRIHRFHNVHSLCRDIRQCNGT